MAALSSSNDDVQQYSFSPQQRSSHARWKRRTDQLHEPAPSVTVLSSSLLHIPASTVATRQAPQPLASTAVHALPHYGVQQLGDGLLLLPPPTADSTDGAAAQSRETVLLVVGAPVRWTSARAFPGLARATPQLPHDVVSKLHLAALTTPPAAQLSAATFISAAPTAAPGALSEPDTDVLLDRLHHATKRLKREQRVLMSGLARDARVVSGFIQGGSGRGASAVKQREAGSSASALLESTVRRLSEVNSQLLLLSAVTQHQIDAVT